MCYCIKRVFTFPLCTFHHFAIYIVLVISQGAPCGFSYKTFQEGSIPGYKRNDLQLSQLKMYNLTYGHYEKIKETRICQHPGAEVSKSDIFWHMCCKYLLVVLIMGIKFNTFLCFGITVSYLLQKKNLFRFSLCQTIILML